MESSNVSDTVIEVPGEHVEGPEDTHPYAREGAASPNRADDPAKGGPASVEDAPPLTSPSQAAAIESLEELVSRGFQQLGRRFDDRLAYDATKERQIDRLHEELQGHKRDLLAKTRRPLIQGLVRLHDDLGKTKTALKRRPAEELTPERFFRTLEDLAEDIELLLGQHGVESFTHPEKRFDPQQQTALVTQDTEDQGMVGLVAARLRPGFIEGNMILQKERVAVYAVPGGARKVASNP